MNQVQSIQKHAVEPEVIVTLAQELDALLTAYVRGREALDDVRQWLADHVQEVLNADDERLLELDGLAWLLIAAIELGDRTEEGVRTEMARVAVVGVSHVPPGDLL